MKHDCYEASSLRSLEWLLKDTFYALRALRKNPGFALTAILTLAIGVGANTAIFSFVNAILLKQLPAPHPERLVKFSYIDHGERRGAVWKLSSVDEIAKRNTVLDGIFGWSTRPVNFSANGDSAEWIDGEMVTGQYFRTLEVQPAAGRLFDDDDVRNADANPVCVLSYALWQREFAGSSAVIGRTVFLNGHSYHVLGVTARGFYGAALQQRFDVAVPATRFGDFMPAFGAGSGVDWLKTLSWMTPMARLKPGISRAQAEAEIQRQEPDWRKRTLVLDDGSQGINPMRSSFGRPVIVLMAVVALVLLLTCANLANLLLARSQARAKEFALRLAIGASRWRLIRQLLAESLLIAFGGGLASIMLAFWISRTLLAFLNAGRAAVYALHLEPDPAVLVFSILLSAVTAILFGLLPAWQATRPDLLPALQQGSGASGPPARVLFRRSLVVFQIALSLIIVFAAGLLTRTLRTLATVDLGFQPDRVIALNVDPGASGHSAAEVAAIFDQMLERVRTLPGVKTASLVASPPNGSMGISMSVEVPGYTPAGVGDKAAREPVVAFNFISPDYFATLGQSFIGGRDFEARDNRSGPRVAIVNEKFVRHYFGGRDPVGKKLRQGGGELEIVGVVSDARDQDIRKGAQETVYLPEKQSQTSGLTLLARTTNDPRHVIPLLLGTVHSIDHGLPVYSVHTLDLDVAANLKTERILGYLSTLFAALAMLLAAIGLYGVVAYSVVCRTREIGIRFAVGAQRREVAGLFARESFILVLSGLIIGAPMALASAQALKSLLFGVAVTDPVTLVISIAVLAFAAFLATSIPLWRAAKVNPVVALRWE